MSEFSTFLTLGFSHIIDFKGYDHLLFLFALCAIYDMESIKKVIILVTAFTLGHSLTLALAALDVLDLNADVIEFLIPLTIFITAFINFFQRKRRWRDRMPSQRFRYALAAVFGLIHGLGFSNYLKSMLGTGSVVGPLLSFNLGIELGQILIVGIFLMITFVLRKMLNVKRREINLIVSGAAAGISLVLMLEGWPW